MVGDGVNDAPALMEAMLESRSATPGRHQGSLTKREGYRVSQRTWACQNHYGGGGLGAMRRCRLGSSWLSVCESTGGKLGYPWGHGGVNSGKGG
jgi:hypothetical protein